MKVLELRAFGLDSLTLTERPEPRPGPGQVLLHMRAFSLNYRDLMVVKGIYNPKQRLPLVPLSDGAGKVAAVGEGVTRVKVGDRVAGIFMQKWLSGPITEEKSRSALGARPRECWPNTWSCTRTVWSTSRITSRTRRRQRFPARPSRPGTR